MMLLAIFLPFVYFLCVKKWMMFMVTFIMFIISIPLAFFVIPALVLWAIAMAMAIYDCKKKQMLILMDKQAHKIGKSVADNMAAKPS